MADLEKLSVAMGDLEEEDVVALLNEVMAEGGLEADAALDACQKGMAIVGDRFETGEYFVADLIYAGELMSGAVNILKDALVKSGGDTTREKLVLCTVKGDLHDIGKNIVRSILEAGGFDVIDLGIDVAPETIIAELQKSGARILGMSGVLTLALDSMRATVDALAVAGLRDKVKVIIGGAPVNAEACAYVGADDWSTNPQKSVHICRAWADAA
jgi:methanogenic corrinoid protein MtbC1